MPEPPGESWGFPNPATPEGSAWYYVARFCPPPRRDPVATWLAWFDHLDRIARQARDPGVSRLRLDWWRSEAERVQDGRAHHPIAQALSAHAGRAWQLQRMLEVIDGVEQTLLARRPEDLADWRRLAIQRWSGRMALLAGTEHEPEWAICDAAGGYYATVTSLQHLGREIARERMPLPRAESDAAGLDLAALRSERPQPALTQLAGALLARAESDWQPLRAQARGTPGMAPVLALCAQAGRVARLLRRRGFQTQRRAPLPTPLGLLWSAWRKR